MARPDLNDPIQRTAHRRELRAYGRTWRRGRAGAVGDRRGGGAGRGGGFDPLSLALVLGGPAVLIPVIIARSRDHRWRMAASDSD